MTPKSGSPDKDLWPRIDAILDEVLDLPVDEREKLTLKLCGDDKELRAAVLRFLADAAAAEGFLDQPAGERSAALVADSLENTDPALRLGEHLGAWVLTEILGEGGMGVVYGAQRADGQYEAEAAVKLMLGVSPRSPLGDRLLAERQILARLDDARIARLIDGGLSDDGYPYLVMEKVIGRDILEHCEAENLGLSTRLDLFAEVCTAVHSAHQHMVLHCDLKPSNILVTRRGELKLLDFGIARSLIATEADGSHPMARMLTPGYASPEQQAGGELTAASDVYGLGVLLYELLTGCRPGDEPAASSFPWARRLGGDLGRVMAKALAPNLDQRYGSARELAEDLMRWRRRQPVTATPNTFWYRLRKLLVRNKLAAGAVTVILVVVLGGVVGTMRQARIAARERDQAQLAAARTQTINDFLTGLFNVADPNENLGTDPTAREILDKGREDIAALEGQPDLQAPLLSTLAGVYFQLGEYQTSLDLYEAEIAAEESFFGPESGPVSDTRIDIAVAMLELDMIEEAREQIERCLAFRLAHPQEDPRWLWIPRNVKARVLRELNETQAAVAIYEKNLANIDPDLADLQQDLGRSWHNYASALNNLDRLAAADSAYARALLHYQRSIPDHHSLYGSLYSNWALVADKLEDFERAEQYYRLSLANKRRLQHNQAQIGVSLSNLGNFLVESERPEEAVPLLLEAVAIQRKAFGENHLYVAAAEINLGSAYLAMGDPVQAEARYRTGERILRKVRGDDSGFVAIALTRRGQAARAAGDLQAAVGLLEQAVALHRVNLPSMRYQFGEALLELGEVELERGQVETSQALAGEAVAVFRDILGNDHTLTKRAIKLKDG